GRVVVAGRSLRWFPLIYAVSFLGLAFYCTVKGVRKNQGLEEEQLRLGFVYGLALAVVWTTFGFLGAICLGKFLTGFKNARTEYRVQELLVEYHDRLRDQGLLDRSGETGRSGDQGQPIRSEKNRTSPTAGSGETIPES